ncbi:MAG: glycosyltransferase family 4 protein [archaeon]|nr:MAG: glycosyltransferase family 4 protein [archaeon]
MRILIVHSGMYVYGGAEHLIVRLANYMTKKGIKNGILTTEIPDQMRKDLDDTEIIVEKKDRLPFDFGEILALNKGVRKNSHKYDVLNIHNYPAEYSLLFNKKPSVWMCNEPAVFLRLKLAKSLFSRIKNSILLKIGKCLAKEKINRVVVADEYNYKRFKKIYDKNPNRIAPYGIDYPFFSKRIKKKKSKDFTVLHVGMLNPFKNQIETLKTLNKIKDKIPKLKIIFAGWGEDKDKSVLDDYIKKNKLEKFVSFTGHVDRSKVRGLYNSCDVLLHPVKAQGGWLAPFEALCASLPIIVSDEMTASPMIRKEGVGTVTKDFVKSILDVYKNSKKHKKIAEKGKKFVREKLSWDRFSEGIVQECRKVISN